jgi:hypothetical protein
MPEADGYKYKWNIFEITKVGLMETILALTSES